MLYFEIQRWINVVLVSKELTDYANREEAGSCYHCNTVARATLGWGDSVLREHRKNVHQQSGRHCVKSCKQEESIWKGVQEFSIHYLLLRL